MRVAFVGKFELLHDEEYIARSFESIGHDVVRIEDSYAPETVLQRVDEYHPDICIFLKYDRAGLLIPALRDRNVKSICWVFDIYFGYHREESVPLLPYFKADVVVTTDGGHAKQWEDAGINHIVVRQGIYKEECVLIPREDPDHDVVFVGSHNPHNKTRSESITVIKRNYHNYTWYGSRGTNEIRGMDLNKLYAKTKIVVGDSVYSPNYWSNRVVETLGRGGFLIHVDTPGIRQEYPDLVTYEPGYYRDLIDKVDYYMNHEEERRAIIKKNFEHVHKNYTMDKKCAELLSNI